MTAELSATATQKIFDTLARELAARPQQVASAVALLDEGATVPFIARYRKEADELCVLAIQLPERA